MGTSASEIETSLMRPFKVHVLGCGSATPTTKHHPSSQVVEMRGKLFLVDCAEGTQVQLRKAHCRFTQISHVFISHLHGDHCLGLIGLISSFGLTGRTAPMHVFADGSFEPLFRQMMAFFCPRLSFTTFFHPVDTTAAQVVYEDNSVSVSTIPLDHRVPCCGYLFKEKPAPPYLNRDLMEYYNVPFSEVDAIKEGKDFITAKGEVIPATRLLVPASQPRSYAYCSDTRYVPTLHHLIKGVDLLYHESTYDSQYQHLANAYYHSTAADAAKTAKDAGAKKLMLGHYSSRYDNEELLKTEAEAIFPNVILAQEGLVVEVGT